MPTTSRATANERELTYDIKFLLVVLLLFVFYPVGLILMWVWMPWPTWLKLLISFPLLIFIFMFFMGLVFLGRFWQITKGGNWQQMPPMMRYYRGYYYQGGGRMPMMPYYQNGGANPSPSETVSPTVTLPTSATTY